MFTTPRALLSSLARYRGLCHKHVRCYKTKGAKNKKNRPPDVDPPVVIKRIRRKDLVFPTRPMLETTEKAREALDTFDRIIGSKTANGRTKRWEAPTLCDKDKIDAIIERVGLAEFAGKTILEMNPGPGLFAERILEKVKPAQYIALEFRKVFHASLRELQGTTKDGKPIKIDVVEKDGFEWSAYQDMEEEGLLPFDKLSHPRHETNPNLIFIATARDARMAQLVAQWIDTLGTSSWIQKFGRVKMLLFVDRPVRQRVLAQPGSLHRTKVTFMREATCDVREICHNGYVPLTVRNMLRHVWQQDFQDLPQSPDSISLTPDDFFPPAALSLLEITPYPASQITAPWDTFEFIAKTLLVNRSTPLYQQIRTIASGAYVIMEDLDPALHAKWPRNMTVSEINSIAVAFDKWPFKPLFLDHDPMNPVEIRARRKMYGRLLRQGQGKDYNQSSTKPLVLPDAEGTPFVAGDDDVDVTFGNTSVTDA